MAGGGMRQAGILAAAGSYALDHHIQRLADDHVLAKRLAEGLADINELVVEAPQSNIVFVDLSEPARTRAKELIAFLEAREILITGLYRLRFVTHLDISADDIERTIVAVRDFFAGGNS
jgi:threonine aldolase